MPLPPPAPSSGQLRLGVPKRTPELAAQLEDQVLEWGGDKPIHRWVRPLRLLCAFPRGGASAVGWEGLMVV